VFDGIAIYNAIRSFKGAKTVYVDGVAASIASVIALAGEKVITSHGAQWMVHDPAGGLAMFGTTEEIENEARKMTAALRKVRENLVGIYVDNTGRSLSEVSAWMTAETWMTADEAMERGLTDEVERPEPIEQPQTKTATASAQIRERTLSNLRNAASRSTTRPAGTTKHRSELGETRNGCHYAEREADHQGG
jgi:ATP-dependent protease ClpP protease subunit